MAPSRSIQTGTRATSVPSDPPSSDPSSAPPGASLSDSARSDAAQARTAQPDSRTAVLFDAADIRRTVDRIAHQILENVGETDVLLVGIPSRGVPIAERLADRMGQFTGRTVATGRLDITLYRDDLRDRPPRPLAETDLPQTGIDGLTVVLVDDVLYSGRTVRAAMDALRDHGRPAAIRLAVLVDRGHRQLPIRADFVGKNIPTAFDDDVAVQLAEIDGFDAVHLVRAA